MIIMWSYLFVIFSAQDDDSIQIKFTTEKELYRLWMIYSDQNLLSMW